MARGKFIVIEGLDGAGTTTQTEALQRSLKRKVPGLEVDITKEPTAGPAGAMARMVLDGRLRFAAETSSEGVPADVTLALLFAADRVDHLNHDVLPKLAEGRTVISDRYYHSSFAYQRTGISFDWLATVNYHCPPPDLTVFLDVPVDVCMRRIRSSRFSTQIYEGKEDLERSREKYLEALSYLAGGVKTLWCLTEMFHRVI